MATRKPKAPKMPKAPKATASSEVLEKYAKTIADKKAKYQKDLKEYESEMNKRKSLRKKIETLKSGKK